MGLLHGRWRGSASAGAGLPLLPPLPLLPLLLPAPAPTTTDTPPPHSGIHHELSHRRNTGKTFHLRHSPNRTTSTSMLAQRVSAAKAPCTKAQLRAAPKPTVARAQPARQQQQQQQQKLALAGLAALSVVCATQPVSAVACARWVRA